MHTRPFGFTLIEVIMTVAIFSLIAYGLIALVSGVFTNSTQQGSLLVGSDQARKIAFNLTNELRNASTGVNGAYSLAQTDDQQLVFYSYFNNFGDIEKLRYFVQNGKLYKELTKPSGNTYNSAQEVVISVLDDLANGPSTPIFYYYDGTYNGNTDNHLTQPVNINQIRLIKLNLMVYKKAGVANTATYTVSDGAAIRQLKDNLGN